MNHKNRINLTVTFLLIALTLILTACNAQSQAAAIEPDRVSLQLNWIYQAQFAGYFVAQQEGLYTAENLKVDIIPGDATFKPIDKLISREVDFAVATDAIEVLQAREAGHPVVAVAAIFQQNANIWISLAEKNIKTAEDMIGKRVGVRAVGEIPYNILLTAAGIDHAEVNEITVNDFTIRPLIDGEVDVIHDYALSGPLTAKEQGYELNVISLADEGVLLPNELLIVHEELLETKPDLVKRFVQASLEGWKLAVSKPDTGVKATLQFDETLNPDHQTNMMNATIALVSSGETPIGHMDEQMWQQVSQVALDHKLISKSIPLEEIYTTQFLQ
jgi:NitT/TauT family transport system substrate-binding protein